MLGAINKMDNGIAITDNATKVVEKPKNHNKIHNLTKETLGAVGKVKKKEEKMKIQMVVEMAMKEEEV